MVWMPGTLKVVKSIQQVLLEKFHRGIKLKILIGLFLEAMTFIFGHQIPHWCSLFLQCRYDLIVFTHWNTRIVLPGDHQHWLFDLLDIVHRRDALQKFAHLWIALIAVLDAPQISPVRLG